MTLITSNSENRFLSELLLGNLEEKHSSQIPAATREQHLLLQATLATWDALLRMNLSAFDPQVGENGCQIRAVIIALVVPECLKTFRSKIHLIQKAISEYQNEFQNLSKHECVKRKLSLINIIRTHLDVALTDNEIFLVMSYILTVIKAVNFADNHFRLEHQTAPRRLQEKIAHDVRNEFCRRFARSLQRMVASCSANFIHELVSRSEDEEDRKMLLANNIILCRDLHCSPCFRSTKVVMEIALKRQIPLVLWTQQMSPKKDKALREVVVYYVSDGLRWKEKTPDLCELNKPAIVIKGVTCGRLTKLPNKRRSRELFSSMNPSTFIFANAASHRQYLDESIQISNDQLLNHFKELNRKLRCSKDKPGFFVPIHIYCDTLDNISNFKYIVNAHLLNYAQFYYIRRTGITNYNPDERARALLIQEHLATSALSTSALATVELRKTKELLGNLHISEAQFECFKHLDKCKKPNRDPSEIVISKFAKLEDELKFIGLQQKERFGNPYWYPSFIHGMHKLLKYAKDHKNPVEFLLDHRSFWFYDGVNIIKYLATDAKNFENPEVLDAFFEILKEDEMRIDGRKACLLALGEALQNPKLRNKIIEFLIEFEFCFPPTLRRLSWQLLISVLEDSETKAFYQTLLYMKRVNK